MNPEKQKELLTHIPHHPGVYKFFDKEDILLYVGKAKDLKNRVSSYFMSKQHNHKTVRLVHQIEKIEFTLVDSEFDALLLENNLIKTYQPKYNILLKDDKTYPYIRISKEPFPKVTVTRQVDKKTGFYYGPYTNLKAMYNVLDLFKTLFKLRTCHLWLSESNINANKFKVCLEYHIGNCKGPCVGLQAEKDYLQDIAQIHEILKGNSNFVGNYFKAQMLESAANLAFEQAQEYKQKLDSLTNFQTKSLVVNPNITEVDVFSIVSDEENAFINYLCIKEGAIIHTQNLEVKKKLDETDEDILTLAVVHLRGDNPVKSKEIISNVALSTTMEDILNTIPKIGDKKKLLDLSLKNALFIKKEKMQKADAFNKKKNENNLIKQMQEEMRLPVLPMHIECFDNSNIQGTNPVASMVYFKNGLPLKKEYRHFNIKTVEGPDDFASMREIVHRRYKRLLEENTPLPDLIIVDGGKGQLSSACESLKELQLYGKIPIVGIAKRLEELYYPEDEIPLHLSKKSPVLKLIQRIRDEAHRFAITFHRLKRSNSSLHSSLESIDGIGEATLNKVLKHFKSIKNMQNSPENELIELIGKSKAGLILNALKKEE